MDKETVIWPVGVFVGVVIMLACLAPWQRYNAPSAAANVIIAVSILIPIGILTIFLINEQYSESINRAFANARNPVIATTAIVACVFLLVTLCCMAVHPYDSFENYTDISATVIDAEKRVCVLIERADKFIEGEVGPKGMDTDAEGNSADTPAHREYVMAAQLDARNVLVQIPGFGMAATRSVRVQTPECGLDPKNLKDQNIDNRLTKLESTLRLLTGPVLQRNFDSSMNSKLSCSLTRIPCYDKVEATKNPIEFLVLKEKIDESLYNWAQQAQPSDDPDTYRRNRLALIMEAIGCQEKRILGPIDKKVARMKRGEMSDCEKQKATDHMNSA